MQSHETFMQQQGKLPYKGIELPQHAKQRYKTLSPGCSNVYHTQQRAQQLPAGAGYARAGSNFARLTPVLACWKN
jgi:hypothetical protein